MIEGEVARVAHQEKPIRPESEFRRFMLQRLEKLGIIERKGEHLIVDIDRLRTGLIKQIRQTADLGREDCDVYFQHGQPELLYTIFRDAYVISKQDWEREGIKAKPKKLFYTPETAENAFDPQKIRTQDFYMGLWEVLPVNQSAREALYPSRHERLSMSEVAIVALVYHPKYGDGSRNEQGRMIVRDPKTGEKKPIQGDWFAQMGYRGGNNDQLGGSLQTSREYLRRHAPQIIQRGLLRPEDFRTTTAPGSHERPVEKFRLYPNGMLMMYGVLHTLGRRFARLPYLVKELSPGKGGLIETMPDGQEQIRYTFKIFHPGDPGLIKVNYGKGKMREVANKDLTAVHPYHVTESVGIEQVKKAERFWKELQVNFAALSPDEQERLAKAIEGLDRATRDRLKVFAKRFGMEGVRTFLSVEADAKRGKQILQMVDQLGDPIARSVFDKYNSILDLNEQTTDEMVKHLFVAGGERDLDRTKLAQEFGQRATRVLLEFISKAQTQGKKKRRAEDLMEDLNRYQDDLVLFASGCKTLGKGGELTFEDLRGVEYVSDLVPGALSEKDRAEILTIMRLNWVDQNKQAGDSFKRALEDRLDPQNTDTRFTLLKKDGQVVAFIRFDERSDLGPQALYGGSFNVHPAFRGSAIGTMLMARTIDEKARAGFVLHAHVVPDALVGTSYVEDMGHIVTAVDATKSDEKGKRAPLLSILRDDRLHLLARAPNLTKEKLMKGRTAGVRILTFDLREEKEKFLSTIQRETRAGNVVSRYFADPKNSARRFIAIERDPRISTNTQIGRAAAQKRKDLQ